MSDDYGFPEKRKTKKDKARKRKRNPYKRGGRFRSANVKEGGKK